MIDESEAMDLFWEKADQMYKAEQQKIKELKLNKKELLLLAAHAITRGNLLEEQLHFLLSKKINDELSKIDDSPEKERIIAKAFSLLQADVTKAVSEVNRVTANKRSSNARNAANKMHEDNGTKAKHRAMCAVWASGKYLTRDECATEEYEAIGMTWEAARKSLYHEPEPYRVLSTRDHSIA